MGDNCREAETIGTLRKGQETLEKQVDELFNLDRERLGQVTEAEKSILEMHGSVEELRTEVHTVREDLDKVVTDIADMRETARVKAEKDHLFQVGMKSDIERLFTVIKDNKPTPPEPFMAVRVSKFFGANPKTLILLCLIGGFVFLASLMILTGQTEHLPELWQGLNPFKPAGIK